MSSEVKGMDDLPGYFDPATQAGLARVLDVDASVISRLGRHGIFPAGGRVIDWLRNAWALRSDQLGGRAGDHQSELTMQRARQAKADADLKEIQIGRETGQLVEMAYIEPLLASWVVHMRVTFEARANAFIAAVESRYGISIDADMAEAYIVDTLDVVADFKHNITDEAGQADDGEQSAD